MPAKFGNGTGTLRLAGGNIFVTADRGVSSGLIANPINMSANCTISGAGTASDKTGVVKSQSRGRKEGSEPAVEGEIPRERDRRHQREW